MGTDTAILLTQGGAQVVLVGKRLDPLPVVQQRIADAGGEALSLPADLSHEADMKRVVKDTIKRFGALHYAVNNAGVESGSHDLPKLPSAVRNVSIEINLTAAYHCIKTQLPVIEKSGDGSIVNVSSVLADHGFPDRAADATGKHGLRGLTRFIAIDWATRNIGINELQPGVIETPINSNNPEARDAVMAGAILAKRLGQGPKIATGVAFLLSDEAC